MQQAIESVFAELVLGPAPSTDSLRKLCQRYGVEPGDAAALSQSFERLAVYRDLVRGNLREALQSSIPRSMARLGALFDEYFDRFLSEHAPRTHYLRDVTPELLGFCAPLWEKDARVPGYAHELALHESLHIEVSALPSLPCKAESSPSSTSSTERRSLRSRSSSSPVLPMSPISRLKAAHGLVSGASGVSAPV